MIYIIGRNDKYQFGLNHKQDINELTQCNSKMQIKNAYKSQCNTIYEHEDGNHFTAGSGKKKKVFKN